MRAVEELHALIGILAKLGMLDLLRIVDLLDPLAANFLHWVINHLRFPAQLRLS